MGRQGVGTLARVDRRLVGWATLVGTLVAVAWALGPSAPQAGGAGSQVNIVRDRFGVPHVFGSTRAEVSYGAGYALAQDRLWQMYTFSQIAKGRLSEVFGPSVVDIDKEVRFFTYTERERAARFATYPRSIRRDLRAFADGVNAWIEEVNADPSKRPFEFEEYGVLPIPRWSVDDSLALQDVLILAFGSGGGGELGQATLLQDLKRRYGARKALAAFHDLVHRTDPDAEPSIPASLDWRRTPTHARERASRARRLNPDARLSLAGSERIAASAPRAAAGASGALAQLRLLGHGRRALEEATERLTFLDRLAAAFNFGSNAQIVSPGLSRHANTLQTAGPQVGYLVPQWLADIGLHGGGFDAMGMTFAGVGPAVLIGRGPGYAWTTTTGASDLTDTYVERLRPGDPHQYRFRGRWERMDCRTESYTFRGAPFDSDEICRTRHGPVLAFDEAHDRAYSIRYAWFNREGQTVRGFFGANFARGLRDFATDFEMLASNHNMFYVDDRGHYGYWTPGNHPLRAAGVDPRLPQDGRGGSEWRGLRPIEDVPHAVDLKRGWLVNWNNLPSRGWARERAYAAQDNVQDVSAAYRSGRVADPFGGRVNPDGRWAFQDLNANLRRAAFRDHELTFFRSALPRPRALRSALARRALRVVRSWDGFLLDRDDDGRYDSAGVTILHRWLERLRSDVFADHLPADGLGWARVDTELWHVVSPRSSFRLRFDWLGGESRQRTVAKAFDAVVADLAQESGDDPSSWRSEVSYEHYQRLNADLAQDLATSTACDQGAQLLGDCPLPTAEQTRDSELPGDIPDQIEMDRGTYNHIVAYLDRAGAGPIASSRLRAGSVIPPGQSGFISPLGEEDQHYEDQLPVYGEWRYKPMPLTREEVEAQAESTEVITYSP